MAVYRVGVNYSAYAEMEIEADSEQEAIDIANESLDSFEFEGEYDIESVEEVKR